MISILIPCYNAERWVAQAIQSALDQTWQDKEVIVVDDGSTDNSLQIIKSFGARIRWETGPNKGGNAARNRLLELAQGEWLQYLDADDYLMPDKVKCQAEFLNQIAETDIVFSEVMIDFTDAQGRSRVERNPVQEPTEDRWMALARWFMTQTGGQLWRRSALLDVGGWNVAQSCCQENELYLRLLMGGKRFTYCPQTGAVYRVWSEDTVSRRSREKTLQGRMGILQKAENFLGQTGQLTERRHKAINQARFELARSAWLLNHSFAEEIVSVIGHSERGFVPGPPLPMGYRLAYQLFGFRMAETIARWHRNWIARNAVKS